VKKKQNALELFDEWFNSLKSHKPSGGPARGTIAAALVILETLKDDFNLSLEHHRAAGKAQIKGLSPSAVSKILARFGETRPFLKEAGRTNRGGPGDIEKMLHTINCVGLDKLSLEERNRVLVSLQEFLVNKIRDYHNRQKLKLIFSLNKSLWNIIHELLDTAREQGKEGQVAQYLVGAKLQVRFPEIAVGNESYSTADDQLGRPGDFLIGDTAFHVTVAPMAAVYEKCRTNIEQGFKVYLLVPYRRLSAARQIAEDTGIEQQIAIEAIESFVSQNIEELSAFSKQKLATEFKLLLETFNKRVDSIESDKSLLIEIPANL
jgi:hypothetical protein